MDKIRLLIRGYIRALWSLYAKLDTDDFTDLDAEIFALIAMHPAIQDRLDDR